MLIPTLLASISSKVAKGGLENERFRNATYVVSCFDGKTLETKIQFFTGPDISIAPF